MSKKDLKKCLLEIKNEIKDKVKYSSVEEKNNILNNIFNKEKPLKHMVEIGLMTEDELLENYFYNSYITKSRNFLNDIALEGNEYAKIFPKKDRFCGNCEYCQVEYDEDDYECYCRKYKFEIYDEDDACDEWRANSLMIASI